MTRLNITQLGLKMIVGLLNTYPSLTTSKYKHRLEKELLRLSIRVIGRKNRDTHILLTSVAHPYLVIAIRIAGKLVEVQEQEGSGLHATRPSQNHKPPQIGVKCKHRLRKGTTNKK